MHYDIDIDSYIGYPISKGYVRARLAAVGQGPVAVRINSYGGDVQTALDIRQQFLDHDGPVTAYVYGMTASAATILMTGAGKIVMSRYALLLVHCCSGWVDTWGSYNREELEAAIEELRRRSDDLGRLDEVVAALYAQRTGRTAREMADVMARGAWLTAEESLELGLVDELSEEGSAAVMTAADREHFAACGLPLPEHFQNAADRTDNTENNDNNQGKRIMDNQSSSKTTTTALVLSSLCTLLGVTGMEAGEDGSFGLSREQLEAIDAELSRLHGETEQLQASVDQLTKKNADLEAEAKALREADGAETGKVEGATSEEEEAIAGATAAEMYQRYQDII